MKQQTFIGLIKKTKRFIEKKKKKIHTRTAAWYFSLSSDIPAALAGSGLFSEDVGGGFVVHWLNNKDLSFTTSMDLFMQQLRKLSEQHLEQATEDFEQEGAPKFDFGTDLWKNLLAYRLALS